jgi:hypothetical protein
MSPSLSLYRFLPLMMIAIACISFSFLYTYVLIDDQAIIIMFTRRRDIILIELVA